MKPLTFSATLDALSSIGEYVIAATDKAGLGQKQAYHLRLAVDEIATNVIVHSCPKSEPKPLLRLRVDLNEQDLAIILEDTGLPFDPHQTTLPNDLHCSLEKRKIGGFGIYLALKWVDQLRYERVGVWNRNIFVMKRNDC